MFRYFNNKLPKVFTDFFSTCIISKMQLRRQTKSIPVCFSTNVGQQSVKFYGPKVWNQIPLLIRNLKSISIYQTSTTLDKR